MGTGAGVIQHMPTRTGFNAGWYLVRDSAFMVHAYILLLDFVPDS